MSNLTLEALKKALPELCQRRVLLKESEGVGPLPDELVSSIVTIVKRNLDSERVKRVMVISGQHKNLSLDVLEAYVDRVIGYYLKESPRVNALVGKDEVMWEEFRESLLKRTYSVLRDFSTSSASVPSAEEFAQEACLVLIEKLSEYHYDVSFDAWATRILRNIILQPYMRGRDIIDRRPNNVASLDQSLANDPRQTLWEFLSDPSQSAAFERVETRMWLADALDQFNSETQRAVIIYTYFYELSNSEIAKEMATSPGNVAILKFRALRRLRSILEAD